MVTEKECEKRCGMTNKLITTILAGIVFLTGGIGYSVRSTITVGEEFGKHKAAEFERDKAMYDVVKDIKKRLDNIDEKLDK